MLRKNRNVVEIKIESAETSHETKLQEKLCITSRSCFQHYTAF